MANAPQAETLQRWNLNIPDSLQRAWDKLADGQSVGVWKLSPDRLDPTHLEPGGPIGLFVIGDDDMGDVLCLAPDRFQDDRAPAIVMWDPATRQMTRLGDDFDAFLERESHRRLEFLLERGPALDEVTAARAHRGENVDWSTFSEESRLVAELIGDVCRVAGSLNLSTTILDRAAGKAEAPEYLREVDGRDEPGIDRAVAELKKSANTGDAGAAYEVLGFLQLRQKSDEMAQWAFTLAKCSLFSWPNISPTMVTKVAEILKANAAGVKPTDRLDPLFSFLSTQPVAKLDARMNLAKQYLRKKDYPSAAREAEGCLCLSADQAGQRAAYDMLIEVFRAADRTRELAYAELMKSRLG
jgi:hypothetical protein